MSKSWSLIFLFFVTLIILVSWYPVYQIMLTALRSDQGFGPVTLFSWRELSLRNFVQLIGYTDFPRWLLNSFLLSLSSTVAGLFLASSAAYALSRLPMLGKRQLLLILASTQMFPATMILLPLFIILSRLELVDSMLGLFILYSSSALPFCIWQLKTFYDSIPLELEEAARLDGCSSWQIFYKVILPLAKPGLAVTALFSFMSSWSEYPLASVIIQSPHLYTAPLGLKSFQASMATQWGLFAAGSLLVSLPAVMIFFSVSRYLVEGLTLGAVKE